MNDEGRRDDLTSSEERLVRLLLLLRAEPVDGSAVTDAVMRAARWQVLVRGVARALSDVALAVAEGVAVIVGIGRPRKG
jgi:hypothetical protein